MIKALPLRHYLDVMRGKGFCTAQVLAGTSIIADDASHNEDVISLEDYKRVIDNMLRLAGDTGLGLDMGLDTELKHLGALGYAAVSCHTIAEGIESVWGVYRGAFGVMAELRMPRNRTAAVMLDIHAPWRAEPASRFSVEEALTFFLKIGGWVTGLDPKLRKLRFSYPEPAYSQRYHDIFRCPIVFGAARSCAVIDSDWLDYPLKTSDGVLNSMCHENLRGALSQMDAHQSIPFMVQEFLMQRQSHSFAINEAAAHVGVTPRTLERRLQEQSRTYRELVEDARLRLAQRWLKIERMAPQEVGARLGFSDVGSFRRAFKSWTGMTVGEFLGQ